MQDQMQILKTISEFLKKEYQMVLSTNGEYPWTAVLYYSLDNDLNFYFLSDPLTVHCQQIERNSKVALAIAQSPQNPASKKKGVQIYGIAEKISDKHKIIHAINLWKKTLGVKNEDYSYEGMMRKAIKGRMYKITPKKIKFFNEELWKEGEEPTLDL